MKCRYWSGTSTRLEYHDGARALGDLNDDLTKRYGLPVDFSSKITGLAALARALDRNDPLHAQIATLHLQIPDPPVPAKSAPTQEALVELVRQLGASNLLKADWDPQKHPRWRAGSPDSVGGQFAPADGAGADNPADERNAPVIPAQITHPAPLDVPLPRAIPFPYDILPPLVAPNINLRDNVPRNPYPDRPECEEEWAQAFTIVASCWNVGCLDKATIAEWEKHCANALWAKFPRTAAETARVRDMTTSEGNRSIKEPTTPDEVLALHKILRSDPQRYLCIVNEWIRENPKNSHAYFDRHFAWMKIGEPRRALEDLDKVIDLGPAPVSYLSRGEVHRHLGAYEKALEDFDRGEAIDPKQWEEDGFGLLYQADCHARLGHEAEALARCARLPDDFWTPGIAGAPAGNKAEIADTLRRTAAAARRKGR